MLKILLARLRQGYQTAPYPDAEPSLPPRFRGRPILTADRCPDGCRACVEACPTEALQELSDGLRLDLGRCVFCPDCTAACPERAIELTADYHLATSNRDHLAIVSRRSPAPAITHERALEMSRELRTLYGRSFKLRQVSAGGCNACEADANVLGTLVFDLGQFGIQFVASPRHADGLLITGAISANMELALRKTYDAVPDPKVVIAVGACAISGGLYRGRPEVRDGVSDMLPVDLYVPGCPPHPYTLLEGLLGLLGRKRV